MRCPYCGAGDSQVIDTNHDSKGGVRRRRKCKDCNQRFSTYERAILATPLIVKQDGTRVPAVERLCEKYLQAPPAAPTIQPEQRLDLFARAVEPTLQRELKHKGAANGDGSYSAELIGYVEIIG